MGDGRHRADPRGHGRYAIAALGILLVLALVAVGGYALYSFLTEKPSPPPGSVSGSAGSPAPRSMDGALDQAHLISPGPPTLTLEVVGARCYVSVRVPDGPVLLNRTMMKGETARFDQQQLEVTLGDSAAVRVKVNGSPRKGTTRQVETFTVSRASS